MLIPLRRGLGSFNELLTVLPMMKCVLCHGNVAHMCVTFVLTSWQDIVMSIPCGSNFGNIVLLYLFYSPRKLALRLLIYCLPFPVQRCLPFTAFFGQAHCISTMANAIKSDTTERLFSSGCYYYSGPRVCRHSMLFPFSVHRHVLFKMEWTTWDWARLWGPKFHVE